MNLNKLNKTELISKIEKQEKITNDLKKIVSNKNSIQETTKIVESPSFLDVILKLKHWILSFVIISTLIKIFKKYKSIKIY